MTTAKKSTSKKNDVSDVTPDDMANDMAGDMDLFSGTADDTVVIVHRLDETSKKWILQFRLAKHEATEDVLQDLRGGGTYKCREHVVEANGHHTWGRQRTITVDGPTKPLTRLPASMTVAQGGTSTKDNGTDSSVHKPTVDDDMSAIIKGSVINMMNQQQDMTAAQISALRSLIEAGRPKEDTGTTQIMLKQMEMQNQMIIALMSRDNQAPQTDSVEQLVKIAEVMRAVSSPATSMDEQLETMGKYLGLKRDVAEFQTGGDDPEDFMSFAMKRFDKLMDLISTSKNHEELQKSVAALPPGPQPQPQLEGASVNPLWTQVIKSQAGRYVSLAQRSKNPLLAAEADFDGMIDTARQPVKELLLSDSPLGIVIQIAPELQPYTDWVNAYLGMMHRLFFPERYEHEDAPVPPDSSDEKESGLGPPTPESTGAMIMPEQTLEPSQSAGETEIKSGD